MPVRGAVMTRVGVAMAAALRSARPRGVRTPAQWCAMRTGSDANRGATIDCAQDRCQAPIAALAQERIDYAGHAP